MGSSLVPFRRCPDYAGEPCLLLRIKIHQRHAHGPSAFSRNPKAGLDDTHRITVLAIAQLHERLVEALQHGIDQRPIARMQCLEEALRKIRQKGENG